MPNYITHIGTAVPEHKIPQMDLSGFMANAYGLVNGTEVRLNALYRATRIKTRYSVIKDYIAGVENSFYPNNQELEPFPDTASRMNLYKKEAIKLAKGAILDCIKGSKFDLKAITHLITVSCTGFYAPGLDIDIVNQFGLKSNVSRTAINYMGCYAALSALKIGNSILSAHPDSRVLIVAVELCSIHFQKQDTEDNRLANALFGDGAAAVVLESSTNEGVNLEIIHFESEILAEGSSDMVWSVGNQGFEMRLSSYVPAIIEKGIDGLLKSYEKNNSGQFNHFAIHPGGIKILEAVERKLGIGKEQNRFAHQILRNYGNMSSPTILFVLKSLIESFSDKNDGERIFGLAFGPGLTLESMELKVASGG